MGSLAPSSGYVLDKKLRCSKLALRGDITLNLQEFESFDGRMFSSSFF